MKTVSLKSLNLTKKEIALNEEGTEKARVWENHPDNVKEGSPRIEIGYFGKENAYTWQTVKKYS